MASSVFRTGWHNVVKDEEAPLYFSQKALWIFSMLLGVFFGSVLMSMNLSKIDTKKGVVLVVVFGVVYTALQIWLLNRFEVGSPGTFIANAVGASLMQYFFWDKYIGPDTLYRARSIVVPSIIGVVIIAILLLAVLYGSGSI